MKNFSDTAKVTEFTFLRTVKSKAYIITAVLLCSLILTLAAVASGHKQPPPLAQFTHTLYIVSDSGLSIDLADLGNVKTVKKIPADISSAGT